jgi:hypothetical protein
MNVGDVNEMSGQRFVMFLKYTTWHNTEKPRYERGSESKYRTACIPMMTCESAASVPNRRQKRIEIHVPIWPVDLSL